MHPILFQIGGLTIYSYGVFVLLGFIAYTVVVFYEGRRRRQSWGELLILFLAALVGSVLGSRAVWILMLGPEPALLDFYTLFLPGTALFHYMGMLVGGYVGVVIAKESMGLHYLVGDIFAPALPLMMTLVRVGCFLGGCCYGKPTDLPWAIELHGARRHPTQLYELFFQLAFFGLLWYLRDRMPRPDDLLKLYLGSYATFRFFNEFWRDNPVVALGMTVPQFLCLGILLWLAYVLLTRGRGWVGDGVWW
jgi:phosphatidylglycerol:prolipoprotein diacylglycerol transferase